MATIYKRVVDTVAAADTVAKERVLASFYADESSGVRVVSSRGSGQWPHASAATVYDAYSYYRYLLGLTPAQRATAGMSAEAWTSFNQFCEDTFWCVFISHRKEEIVSLRRRLSTWDAAFKVEPIRFFTGQVVQPLDFALGQTAGGASTTLQSLLAGLVADMLSTAGNDAALAVGLPDASLASFDGVWNAKRRILLSVTGNRYISPEVAEPNGTGRSDVLWPYRTANTAVSAEGYVEYLEGLADPSTVGLTADDIVGIRNFLQGAETLVLAARQALESYVFTARVAGAADPLDLFNEFEVIPLDTDDLLYSPTTPATDGTTVPLPAAPSVSVASDRPQWQEGAEDAPTFTVTRSASRGVTEPLTVNLRITQAGGLYSAPGEAGDHEVVIPVGELSAQHTVRLEQDNVDEQPGALTATVRAGTGYTVGSPSAASTTVINDTSLLPFVRISDHSQSVEEGQAISFELTRSGAGAFGPALQVQMRLSQASGPAGVVGGAPLDPFVVSIPAGQASGTFTRRTVDVTSLGRDSLVDVQVRPSTNYNVGNPATERVRVRSNDRPPATVGISVSPATTFASTRDVTVAVRLQERVSVDVPVSVTSNVSGSQSLTITIPANGLEEQSVVTGVTEETATFTLASSSLYSIDPNASEASSSVIERPSFDITVLESPNNTAGRFYARLDFDRGGADAFPDEELSFRGRYRGNATEDAASGSTWRETYIEINPGAGDLSGTDQYYVEVRTDEGVYGEIEFAYLGAIIGYNPIFGSSIVLPIFDVNAPSYGYPSTHSWSFKSLSPGGTFGNSGGVSQSTDPIS